MEKEIYARAYAFDKALLHVVEASEKDPRRRERARSKVAMAKLNQWYEEGKKDYDRTESSRNPKEGD